MVDYTPTQICSTQLTGVVFTSNILVPNSGVDFGGLQFTVPAPNEVLFRSMSLTLNPTLVVGTSPQLFTIGLVDDLDAPVFSALNMPTDQVTLPVYSANHTFVAGTPVTFDFELGVITPPQDPYVGGFDTAYRLLGHSDFQGTVSLVLSYGEVGGGAQTVTFDVTDITLTTDELPFYTGHSSSKYRQSRADYCDRCGGPVFREQLVKDGYTKTLVCPSCYDPPERRRPRWRPPKEVNP